MPDNAYPVMQEMILSRPTQKFLRGSRREPAELPVQNPGTVLVFEVNGSYRALGRQRLSGRESTVVEALSVSVVNTRPTIVEVYLKAPSASAADDFVIKVGFRCQVNSPEVVAEYGLRNITDILKQHLARDGALLAKCAAKHTQDIADVRIEAKAQILAYCKVRPPSIVGMRIDLNSVEVFTPRGEIVHEKEMLRARREHAIGQLRRMNESDAVDYLTGMLASSDVARALAVSRGELSSADAAQQIADRESGHLAGMTDLIKVMAASDRMDRVPLDIQRLYDSAMAALTGEKSLTSAGSLPASGAVDEQPRRLAGQDDDERFLVDEDDLTGGDIA